MSPLLTAPATAAKPQRRALFDTVFMLVALAALFIATGPSPVVTDPDIWLHLRSGQLIVAKHAVPAVDTLSSRAAGHEWIAYGWLFDVLVYGIYSVWGEVDPVFWTGSLSGKAALKMKESQCHAHEKTTRRP